jgi:hypothetical protein
MITNGDLVRRMTDEELFDEFFYFTECVDCDFKRNCKGFRSGKTKHEEECKSLWLEWLGKDASDD